MIWKSHFFDLNKKDNKLILKSELNLLFLLYSSCNKINLFEIFGFISSINSYTFIVKYVSSKSFVL